MTQKTLDGNPAETDELDGAEPFAPGERTEGGMDAVDIERYLAQGYKGVEAGKTVAAAADDIPLIDQDDLDGVPFVVLGVREQEKWSGPEGRRFVDYTMVIVAGQACEFDFDENGAYVIKEPGSMFIMIAGREDSVLGKEMLVRGMNASPANPLLIPNGLFRRDMGNNQFYYTTRPPRDKTQRVNMFPNRPAAG